MMTLNYSMGRHRLAQREGRCSHRGMAGHAASDRARWVFRLEADYVRPLGRTFARDLDFHDKTGVVRLRLRRDGTLVIPAGYAWDGCTPKVVVWDLVLGTPDGVVSTRTGRPKAWQGSLVHDALYQFLPCGLPLTRAEADRIFLEILREDNFAPRWVYYVAVRIFGGGFKWVQARLRRHGGRMRDVTPAEP